MTTIAERVQAGSAWLDEHYPDWFKSIDLGSLEISNCFNCVLGQVYSNHIPDDERNQLVAQVVNTMSEGWSDGDRLHWERDVWRWGGFSILADVHQFDDGAARLGFAADWEDPEFAHAPGQPNQYARLLDEWTRVVISRRLQQVRGLNRELVAV